MSSITEHMVKRGAHGLNCRFDPLEVITLFLSVLLVRFATEDGRTHYMRFALSSLFIVVCCSCLSSTVVLRCLVPVRGHALLFS